MDTNQKVAKRISIIRNGEPFANAFGARFIEDYVEELTIMESINSMTVEMELVINDFGGMFNYLTGTELFKVEISTTNSDKTYFMRANGVESRVVDGKGAEQYIIRCYSEEYLRNEGKNIFGHTAVLFNDNTEASNIVKTLMKDQRYLNSTKRIYAEESLNFHSAVIPSWRPFDLIAFLCQRSYRKNKPLTADKFQGGFQFFESGLGYHFTSIDKMIEDVRNTKVGTNTDPNTGRTAMYEYSLVPKGMSGGIAQGGGDDYFALEGFSVVEEGNLFRRMRDGLFSGYSIGFDPVSIKSSQVGLSSDLPTSAFQYHVADMWNNMEHLDTKRGGNPTVVVDNGIKSFVDTPRRVRYNVIPNNIFDTRSNVNTLNYSQISLLDTYDYVRRSTLKNMIAKAKMSGNLDLYAGKGVKIKIPQSQQADNTKGIRDNDPQYSGKYLIAAVTHTVKGDEMTTLLELRRDSIPN